MAWRRDLRFWPILPHWQALPGRYLSPTEFGGGVKKTDGKRIKDDAMLKDQDRIFTNLYGMEDRSLAGARKRGAWSGTAGFITQGRDWLVEQIKASGLRGRG